LLVGVGDGELGARGQTGAEREKKERNGEDEGFQRWAPENWDVILCGRGKSAPIAGSWQGVYCWV